MRYDEVRATGWQMVAQVVWCATYGGARHVKLTNDAAQIFGAFLHQADLTPAQEQRLLAHGEQEISKQAMEQILGETPDNYRQALDLVRQSNCDQNAAFLTCFSGDLKSIRENVAIQRAHRNFPLRAYDPQEIPLELDPRGRFFICASTSKFEENVVRPRPVLLKIVARASGEDGKPTDADKAALQDFLDSCKVQKNFWNMRGKGDIVDQDIMWVGSRTASVLVNEKDEREIGLGNGANVITYDKEMGEISRVGKIDPVNIERTQTYMELGHGTNRPDFTRPVGAPVDRPGQDTTPPQIFNRNLHLAIGAKELPRGAWINDAGFMDKVTVNLRLASRWLMETGASGQVSLLGTTLRTKVATDDWYYNGSAPAAGTIENLGGQVKTLRDLFGQSVQTARGRVNNGEMKFERPEAQMKAEAFKVSDLFFQAYQGVNVAGGALAPLNDLAAYDKARPNPTLSVVKRPAPGQANKNDQIITLNLKDFVSAGEQGASTKGWTIDVGIRSKNGDNVVWTSAQDAQGRDSLVQVGAKGSGEQELKLYIPAYEAAARAGNPIEIIVRNETGLPVTRYRIPLNQIDWAKDVA